MATPTPIRYAMLPLHQPTRTCFGGDCAIDSWVLSPNSLRRLVPLLLAAMQDRIAVFGQNPALLDQVVQCNRVAREIVVRAFISFRDRKSGIALLLPLGCRLWKRDIRRLKRNSLIGRANRWVAQIPTRVRRQRNRDLGQADAVAFIAIQIHLW